MKTKPATVKQSDQSFARGASGLQAVIQVRNVMTLREAFIAAADPVEASALLLEYPDLDAIPIVSQGEVNQVFTRRDETAHFIDREHLISDSTLIIELASYFKEPHRVLFVLTGNLISGLIHVSDLNSVLCKIAYFAAVHDLERACMEHLRNSLSPSLLDSLSDKRREDFERRRDEFNSKEILPYDAAALNFVDALKLTSRTGCISLSKSDITKLDDVRNRTAHAGRLLYEGPKDLPMLSEVRSLAQRKLDELLAS
jgi:hypothetical protein